MGRRSATQRSSVRRHSTKDAVIPPAPPPMPAVDHGPAWRWWATALVIVVLVVAAYWRTLDNEFVSFDDHKYICENELVTGGLGAIWSDLWNPDFKLHYYPLTFTTFWIEHKLVGFGPPPTAENRGQPAHWLYHVTQMALHAVNATLVMLVLRALGMQFWIAGTVAVIFAVHPINAASVAWMSERKNLLSAMFFWLSLLTYISYRRRRRETPSVSVPVAHGSYLASLGLFLLGLLAKTAALVLAPVLLVTDRVLDGRWTKASILRSVPFFGLALIMAADTAARERVIEVGEALPTDVFLRPFIALAAITHYVQKMLIPVNQAILYPRWGESFAEPRYWISLAVVGLAAALIWRFRRWLGDQWLWGLALFLLTIAPVLGLKYFIWNQFAFVSDHYVYLGSTGVIAMVVILVGRALRIDASAAPRVARSAVWRVRAAMGMLLAVLALCGFRTSQQSDTWQNDLTLWSHTIGVSPDSLVAHFNLGTQYARNGEFESAARCFKRCTEINPGYVSAKVYLARAFGQLGRIDAAVAAYRDAADTSERRSPQSWSARAALADYLVQIGRVREAADAYRIVLTKDPPDRQAIEAKLEQLNRSSRDPISRP